MTETSSTTFDELWQIGDVTPVLIVIRGRRHRLVCWAVSLLLLSAAGCSDGTVVANGRVLLEGEAVSGGRLLLTPIGGGPQAFSLVTEGGAFALRATGDSLGAFPGSYRVSFHQPLDAKARAQIGRELAGQLAADELSVSFRGPRDQPLVIPDAGDENLVIDISVGKGWTRSLNE
jgi:hypothetical protein